MNAGTKYPQLSNCFVMEMQDDIEHIAKTTRDVMWLTKGTGGIGLSVTKLRAQGSPIRSNNTTSTGPIPFMHTIDSVLRAVSRGGKKFGALCFYMENWHLDFPEFLDLRQNSGDPYRRTRTANTAVWIRDEFMKRVQNDEDWYLFDPLEVPDLNELYGKRVLGALRRTTSREAEAGRMRVHKKIGAREQFKSILMALQTTSHPWLTWKDTINNRALNNNTGTIHSSNLCTEITLPQDRDNVSVCNLASINLSRHLVLTRGRHPRHGLGAGSRRAPKLAVRQLDNLIDITRLERRRGGPLQRAEPGHRPRRHGLHRRRGAPRLLSYESEEAYDLIDEIMEHVSYAAIDGVGRPRAGARRVPELRGLRLVEGPRAVRHHRAHRGRPRRADQGRTAPRGSTGTRCASRSRAACATRRSWRSRRPHPSASSPARRPASTRSSRRSSAGRPRAASSSR